MFSSIWGENQRIANWLWQSLYLRYDTARYVSAVLSSPFFNIGLVLIALSFLLPTKGDIESSTKVEVKSPEGVEEIYSLKELRQNLLDGKITPEWIARKRGETDYKPVIEVLYPPNAA